MNVFIVGDADSLLVEEIRTLCKENGHWVRVATFEGDGYEDFFVEGEDLIVGTEVVVEVIVQNLLAKEKMLVDLCDRLPSNTLFLTAALNASATHVASWYYTMSKRMVGYAAIPPFAHSTVVELMPALQSAPDAIEQAKAFWRSIGREPVTIADSVGGVLPRVVCNLVNEAAYALMEGVATPADIDLAMQLGTNHPRGPLAWADLIGIPTVVAILEALGREFGTAQYQPAPLLKQYARAGRRFYGETTA